MRQQAAGKADVAAHMYPSQVSAAISGQTFVVALRGVSGNFFSTLRVQPQAGRLLNQSDDDAGAPLAAVLSHRVWSQQLAADPSVIGKSVRINNLSYTVAGVLPEAFSGLGPGDTTGVYTTIRQSPKMLEPESWYAQGLTNNRQWFFQLLARRDPSIEEPALRALLQAAFAAGWASQPSSPDQTPALILSNASNGLGGVRRDFGDPATMLLALAGMVLLVACANIANLLLARSVQREKEVVLRISLGCGQSRLIRQFLAEALMLAALGGIASIAVAWIFGQVLIPLLPSDAEFMQFRLDPGSILITAGITVLTALLFGLYPAIRSARVDPAPALKEGAGSGGTASRARLLPARLLVTVQVALSVLLISAALAFTTRLQEIVARDSGFERGHLLLFDIRPGETGFQGARLSQFYQDLESRIAALPGVQSAALSQTRPMRGGGYFDEVGLPGSSKNTPTAIHHATSSFFSSLGVAIVAGRTFTPVEVSTKSPVAVISEDLARDLGLPNPVGATIQSAKRLLTVVGVARTASYSRLTQSNAILYIPFNLENASATMTIRTSVPPMAVLAPVRESVKALHPDLPMVDVRTMEQQISLVLVRERLFAWLCGCFGVLALVLCIVGLYGLMSHATARRTAEIGIRMALGASRSDVMTHVLRDGLGLAFLGLLVGLPLAVVCIQFAQSQRLIPEGPLPVLPIAGAVIVMSVSAFLAVFGPASRASSIDPIRALWRA
jgi:predicted permease